MLFNQSSLRVEIELDWFVSHTGVSYEFPVKETGIKAKNYGCCHERLTYCVSIVATTMQAAVNKRKWGFCSEHYSYYLCANCSLSSFLSASRYSDKCLGMRHILGILPLVIWCVRSLYVDNILTFFHMPVGGLRDVLSRDLWIFPWYRQSDGDWLVFYQSEQVPALVLYIFYRCCALHLWARLLRASWWDSFGAPYMPLQTQKYHQHPCRKSCNSSYTGKLAARGRIGVPRRVRHLGICRF